MNKINMYKNDYLQLDSKTFKRKIIRSNKNFQQTENSQKKIKYAENNNYKRKNTEIINNSQNNKKYKFDSNDENDITNINNRCYFKFYYS
jgi:hypothetical protein